MVNKLFVPCAGTICIKFKRYGLHSAQRTNHNLKLCAFAASTCLKLIPTDKGGGEATAADWHAK